MTQKNFMFKTIAFAFLFATALQFTACGDNPIEVENGKDFDFGKQEIKLALDSVASMRNKVDFYQCMQENTAISNEKTRKARCETFIKKYSGDTDISIIIKMVSDTVNYSDKGDYTRIQPGSSSSANSSSSEAIKDTTAHYLTVNKNLNITLTSYKQLADSISETEKVGDPEIRFIVRTFIEGDSSGYEPLTALVLDTLNVKKWSGKKAATVLIPRGIDQIEICPIVIEQNELKDQFKNETVLKDECLIVKKIGLIKDMETTSQTTSKEKVEIKWDWFLYEVE